MTYIITIGINRFKRESYVQKEFQTFKDLVQFLREDRQDTLANEFNKKNCSWISSETCKENTTFNQDNFEQNGRVIILDFDGELKLKDCKTISEENNFSYYIYNSTNNGNKGKEKFRLILPLDKALKDKEEVRTFYKAINKLFEEKADSSKLTSCIFMNKPQNWISTTRGVEPNPTTKELDEYYFDGIAVNTDAVMKEFPEEKVEYHEWDSEALDKIDPKKQKQFTQRAKEDFSYIPSSLGKRHSGLWNLALKLKSYGLDGFEIQTVLELVNYKKSDSNIRYIMKDIKNKYISINPSVYRTEFYIKEIIDKKLDEFKTTKNPIIITQDKKVSELLEFQTNDIFIEGVNLFSSPTNSGKTFYVLNKYINYIDKDDFVVLLVPYLTLLQEIKTNDNVYTLSGGDEFNIEAAREKRVIVCTYDKINTLLYAVDSEFLFDKCHFFIDEAHNSYSSYSYRYQTLNRIFNTLVTHAAYKKLILMSGTFSTSFFRSDFIDNHIHVRREVSHKVKECNVIISSSSTVDSAINYLIKLYNEDNSRLQIVYMNDKDKSYEISQALNEQKKIKTLLLNADTKNDDDIREIYKTNEIPSDINVLFMTKIGEEGISFNNEIYAIHTIGKIDSTVAEQLGNRPRKHPTKLFIHTKYKDERKPSYVLNPNYKEIEKEYLDKVETINKDIKVNKLQYEERKRELFFKFTIWDKYSNFVALAPLAISTFLYDNDKTNEFIFYNYYFKQKMSHYGWNVEFIIDVDEATQKLDFKNITSSNHRKDIALKVFYLFKQYEDSEDIKGIDSFDINGFTNYVKDNINNELSEMFIEQLYKDYKYLTNHVDDTIIIEAIESTDKYNRHLKRLFERIDRQLHGNWRMDSFVFNYIQINKAYTSDELQEFGQDYFKELYKYSPELRQPRKVSTQSLNNLLSDYFNTEKSSKRIDGKKQQITKILNKITVSLKGDKLDQVTPDDGYGFREELHDTIRYLDFIAMEEEPENYITPEEYKDVMNRKKELERILSDKDSNINRSFSYLDEWL